MAELTMFLAFGNGCWVKDEDRKKAEKDLVRLGGGPLVATYKIHPDTYVDGMGYMTFPRDHEPVKCD